MVVNIRIELTDEQRQQLAVSLGGKNKFATRQQVTDFVTGVVDKASDRSPLQQKLDQLASLGWSPDKLRAYARGWKVLDAK